MVEQYLSKLTLQKNINQNAQVYNPDVTGDYTIEIQTDGKLLVTTSVNV